MQVQIALVLLGMLIVLLMKGGVRFKSIPAPATAYRRRTIKSKSDATTRGK